MHKALKSSGGLLMLHAPARSEISRRELGSRDGEEELLSLLPQMIRARRADCSGPEDRNLHFSSTTMRFATAPSGRCRSGLLGTPCPKASA
jgi:hypothetical protein